METVDKVMSRPLTGVERLRLFAAMPSVFTFDEEDAERAVEEINGEPLLVDQLRAALAQVEMLESLRPHWAQGYSSDSMAAQSATCALSAIWRLLGVDNQTAALDKLRAMTSAEPPRTDVDDCAYLYFKPGGKWKYGGRGRFPRPQHDGWHEVDRDEIIRENGGMPGIVSRGADYVVIVMPDEACDVRSAYPRMLKPEAAR